MRRLCLVQWLLRGLLRPRRLLHQHNTKSKPKLRAQLLGFLSQRTRARQ